jgi:hypothetical protein
VPQLPGVDQAGFDLLEEVAGSQVHSHACPHRDSCRVSCADSTLYIPEREVLLRNLIEFRNIDELSIFVASGASVVQRPWRWGNKDRDSKALAR